ncbi:MAG TPA: DUF2892 domain-containing protein, partial [Candidatus Baltobacteraceae bacterium]|nr:DUF2892 domain-containing protein [Candidatus Baltobacteraceae bacterium]
MHDARNVGAIERWISVGLGGLLLLGAIRRRDILGAAAGAGAAVLLYRGVTGYCPAYGALGVDTAGQDRRYYNPAASVPYGTGVRVESSIAVVRPAPELYSF